MSKEGFSNEENVEDTTSEPEILSRRSFLKMGVGLGLAAAGVGCAPEGETSKEQLHAEEGVIVDKRYSSGVSVKGVPIPPAYFLYFQFATHSERAQVSRGLFDAFQKGEEVSVMYDEPTPADRLMSSIRLRDIRRKN